MALVKLFDSHCHLNFEAFKDDWKKVLDECQKNNFWVVNIGSQYPTSKRAIEIAEHYEKGVYASIGVHPVHAHEPEHFFNYKRYSDLIKSSKKVVAVGETGIDFFHSAEYFEIQKKTFIDQINLAKEFGLPLVIHGRNSRDEKKNCYEEIYKIVKKEKVKNAVVHCFGGTADEAKKFMDLGFYIGITGIITFKNAKGLQAMVRVVIPLEKILIETDAPYLAPEPYRGKQNKPQYVEFVARKIAELKEKSYNEVSRITFENAKKFYNINLRHTL